MTSVDVSPGLRPFYCPIEPALHPDVRLIESRAIDWLDRFRFYPDARGRARLIGTNSAEFYARFAPSGITGNLQVVVHWVYWAFAFDDACCDSGPYCADPAGFLAMAGVLQRALESPWEPVPGGGPFVTALQDIGRDLHACATPLQVRRFCDAHRAWLFGVAWQIANRSRGRMPSLADYTAMRLNSAGGPPTLALLEIANGAEVPAAEMEAPVVRALTEMTMLIDSWDNDLHSYRMEADEEQTDQNLVKVLSAQYGWTAGRAMDEAYALRDRVMTLFLRTRAKVDGSAALRCYLDGLGHAIRGNTDWALNVPRYNNYGEPMPHPGWTGRPRDTNPAPPPIPAIRWWWRLCELDKENP
ncbi:terpene synthase family protein [Saccharothrix sp. AJ9571]|nr:terpene synthase family protein [Saccharothrix sp. AJ9571]